MSVLGLDRDETVRVLGGSEHLVDLVGAEVDHGGLSALEDAQLARDVILEGGVLDTRDVIAPQVQEDPEGERHPEDAVVLETLARDLHHQVATPGVDRVAQVAPELGRLRRGVVALKLLDAVIGLDRAEDRWGGARRLEDRAKQVGRGRLAFGARDAHDLEVALRVSVDRRGHERHRAAHIVDGDARRSRRSRVEGGEQGGVIGAETGPGSASDCVGEEGGPEGDALADEEVLGRDLARIDRHAADRERRVGVIDARGDARVGEDARERAERDGGEGAGGCGHADSFDSSDGSSGHRAARRARWRASPLLTRPARSRCRPL